MNQLEIGNSKAMQKKITEVEASLKAKDRLQENQGPIRASWEKPVLLTLAVGVLISLALFSLALGSYSGWLDSKAAELTSNGIRVERSIEKSENEKVSIENQVEPISTHRQPEKLQAQEVNHASQNPACAVSQEIRQLIELHNQTRQSGVRCGKSYKPKVSKLHINCRLTSAAQLHSQYMHKKQVLSHRGQDASSAGIRASDVGYLWNGIAENIAEGHISAQSVHQGWLNSKGHCLNIMGESYTDFGAARVGNYWTVMFGFESNR